MSQAIRVGQVLRETVSAPYRNLVTRPTGAAVRCRIEETLDEAGAVVAVLDFSDVDLLDLSCADEIVAKLLMGERGPQYVVLQGLREDQYEAIEHVLTHHCLSHRLIRAERRPDAGGDCYQPFPTP
jgi:hypothetical protein